MPPAVSAASPAAAEPEFAALVAIDWADKHHAYTLSLPGSSQRERGQLENTPEAVELWMIELSQRFGGQPIAVALEQQRGAVVAMLSRYENLHLYPVHPLTLAHYRQAWHPSRSKSDPVDADLLCELLIHHRARLRRLDPDLTPIRVLRSLVENRRKLVDERTALSNRLKDTLKMYFPQVVTWFHNVTTPMVSELLTRWPTLPALQQAKPATLQKFFAEHHSRAEHYLAQIGPAVVATTDAAILETAPAMVAIWLEQVAVLRTGIQTLEGRIASLAHQQVNWVIFTSFPGAGDALAPRLLAGLGTRRDRFQSASELQCFAGIAPVQEASGNSVWIHLRWACPKFLRQTFHEWAACSIPYSPWAKAYYDSLVARGKSHHTAVRALAFRWMRILFRCWQDRQPYCEEIYLASLAKRNPFLYQLANAVKTM